MDCYYRHNISVFYQWQTHLVIVVYYESRKRELKIRLMYEGRYDEWLNLELRNLHDLSIKWGKTRANPRRRRFYYSRIKKGERQGKNVNVTWRSSFGPALFYWVPPHNNGAICQHLRPTEEKTTCVTNKNRREPRIDQRVLSFNNKLSPNYYTNSYQYFRNYFMIEIITWQSWREDGNCGHRHFRADSFG